MLSRILTQAIVALAGVLASPCIAAAQSVTPVEAKAAVPEASWQLAQAIGESQRKLVFITVAEPHRRQVCRVHTFTQEELICSHALGGSRAYRPKQILALMLPGEGPHERLAWVVGLNGGMGVAIWGTVAFAAVCPVCSAATAAVALLVFGACGAILISDSAPDRVFYLAAGQQIGRKFNYVELR